MPAFTISAPPLQEVREALWTRFQTDGNTSGYTWLTEDGKVDSPYLALGSAYLGAGGSDPDRGTYVVVQVDAYADNKDGGADKVCEMIAAVYAALSASAITVVGFSPLAPTIEADVLNPNLQDSPTGALYAQRFARFSFLVIT